MKNVWKILVSIVLILGLVFAMSACDDQSTGKSAYEIAVENGFTGSASDWLNSLAGSDGADGADGVNATSYSLAELYAYAAENGYSGTELEFISDYFASGDGGSEYATNVALLSSVSIVANFTKTVRQGMYPFGSETYNQSYTSAGSGVIYKLNKTAGTAYIITNFHVVYDQSSNTENNISDNIEVYLYGMEYANSKITAAYVGGSLQYDIAVIKITGSDILKNSAARAVTVADSSKIAVGSTAIAVGNPAAAGISATDGIVSVDSEYITMNGADDRTSVTFRVMRVDTAINGGNSGGGLFDSTGRLIGIVNAKIVDSSIENIGYAIPSNISTAVAEKIIEDCDGTDIEKFSRCYVGITVDAAASKSVFNEDTLTAEIVETVAVSKVTEGSLAETKLQIGDVITSVKINDEVLEINRTFTLIDRMISAEPGDVLVFSLIRSGEALTVEITLTNDCLAQVV